MKDQSSIDIFRKQVPPCWEILECTKVHCPSFNSWDIPCWHVPDTCCEGQNKFHFAYKWEACFQCSVFTHNAEAHPHGWNHFISDQVKQFTRDALKQAFSKEVGLIQVVNNLPYGLFTVDKEGRINYINPAAEQIIGLSSFDMIRKPCKDMFKTEICQTACPLKGTARSKKTLENRELTITRTDGRSIPIICSTSALKDYDGNLIGVVELFNDISDLKRLENDLRFSDRKYRRLFENSKDMVFITSNEGLFMDVNQAGIEMLGYTNKEELLALRSLEKVYVNPINTEVFQEQIELHGYVKDFEVAFKKKDGALLHCILSGTAIRGLDGELIGYEGIVKDITSRVNAVQDLQQRHRELSLLNWIALAMNMDKDLDDMLMTALNKVLDVLSLPSGGIFLIDHDKNAFSLNAERRLTESIMDSTGHIILCDEELMNSLLEKDLTLAPEPIFPPFRAAFKNLNETHSLDLICFLITTKEKVYGFLALHIPECQNLTDQDLNFLGSLGNFLGAAVEEARLLQTIANHREELKMLTARLFNSQDLERKRIARELHDETGQALTAINFTIASIENNLAKISHHLELEESISDLKRQINHTYSEMHRISQRLHPALLCDLGLEPALDSFVTRVSESSDLKIAFRMVGFKGRVDTEIETVLYRLSQAALTNTLKHSKAKNFNLSIIKSYPHIILSAEDDGIGFDEGELYNRKKGLGLLSMRERAAMMGGKFSLRTSEGKGTRIRIEIPIKDDSRNK